MSEDDFRQLINHRFDAMHRDIERLIADQHAEQGTWRHWCEDLEERLRKIEHHCAVCTGAHRARGELSAGTIAKMLAAFTLLTAIAQVVVKYL